MLQSGTSLCFGVNNEKKLNSNKLMHLCVTRHVHADGACICICMTHTAGVVSGGSNPSRGTEDNHETSC
jgi:hypothetical protein